jgi:hypothetical protein
LGFHRYSRNDRSWASWLHQSLERYEVPRTLVGNPHPTGGTIPFRLFPIFKDREELATAATLSENISQALTSSRYLIVMCSPHAATSRWVNEEIRQFKQQGGWDRILSLIVAGEPNASVNSSAQDASRECFPPTLRFTFAILLLEI